LPQIPLDVEFVKHELQGNDEMQKSRVSVVIEALQELALVSGDEEVGRQMERVLN
jgi:hypothetical protein